MTVDTKTQGASTTATPDAGAVSGSIQGMEQGIFLFFDAAMYQISLSMCAHS